MLTFFYLPLQRFIRHEIEKYNHKFIIMKHKDHQNVR